MDYIKAAEELLDIQSALQRLPGNSEISRMGRRRVVRALLPAHPRGALLPKEISGVMMVSTARVAALLNGMEAKRLVSRAPYEPDSRRIVVSLTAEGREQIERGRAEDHGHVRARAREHRPRGHPGAHTHTEEAARRLRPGVTGRGPRRRPYRKESGVNMQQVKLNYKKQAIICRVGEQEIYGVAFIPQPRRRTPLAIFAHELGANHNSGVPYAEMLAESGVAAYTFDFRGGSATSRSDGSTDSMSVMTEAEDICAVLDAAKTWDFVDSDRIVLFGASQGGAASAIAAARRQDEICALHAAVSRARYL